MYRVIKQDRRLCATFCSGCATQVRGTMAFRSEIYHCSLGVLACMTRYLGFLMAHTVQFAVEAGKSLVNWYGAVQVRSNCRKWRFPVYIFPLRSNLLVILTGKKDCRFVSSGLLWTPCSFSASSDCAGMLNTKNQLVYVCTCVFWGWLAVSECTLLFFEIEAVAVCRL